MVELLGNVIERRLHLVTRQLHTHKSTDTEQTHTHTHFHKSTGVCEDCPQHFRAHPLSTTKEIRSKAAVLFGALPLLIHAHALSRPQPIPSSLSLIHDLACLYTYTHMYYIQLLTADVSKYLSPLSRPNSSASALLTTRRSC